MTEITARAHTRTKRMKVFFRRSFRDAGTCLLLGSPFGPGVSTPPQSIEPLPDALPVHTKALPEKARFLSLFLILICAVFR